MEEQKSNRSSSTNATQPDQQQKPKKESSSSQIPQVIDPSKYKTFVDEVKSKSLNTFEMLSSSVMNAIHTEDSIIYNPKTIHFLNTKYPVYPLALNQRILEKFSDDTLFFMFFVQQDAQKKDIAFKQLAKRNWMFNNKYHTFFQLCGNPKSQNEEFIEGKFKYFEHEKEWIVKMKKDFKFEYAHYEKMITNNN